MIDIVNKSIKITFNSCPHMTNTKPLSFDTLVKSQLCGQGVSILNGFFAFIPCVSRCCEFGSGIVKSFFRAIKVNF